MTDRGGDAGFELVGRHGAAQGRDPWGVLLERLRDIVRRGERCVIVAHDVIAIFARVVTDVVATVAAGENSRQPPCASSHTGPSVNWKPSASL